MVSISRHNSVAFVSQTTALLRWTDFERIIVVLAVSHWGSATSDAWTLASTREAVIRPLAEAPKLSHAQAEVAAATLGISRSLVYRLVAQFRERPQTSTLLLRRRSLRRQTPLRARFVERLIAEAIEQVYLQPERPRISDAQ